MLVPGLAVYVPIKPMAHTNDIDGISEEADARKLLVLPFSVGWVLFPVQPVSNALALTRGLLSTNCVAPAPQYVLQSLH